MDTLIKLWRLKENFTINNLNNMDIKISEIQEVLKEIFEDEEGVASSVEIVIMWSTKSKSTINLEPSPIP